ncbi:MAG TPA: amidase [Chloroflexota bacterium]|jgi:aspartyl-tRNA(Asn)/glutamyl-tRNA(Gln) amidotransferase subunit A|nr:amidase [Chloroflexota bacterium]
MTTNGVDLLQLSATDLAARLSTGAASPTAVADAVAERVAATNAMQRSFISFDAADVAAQARALAREIPRGLLHGVPVAIKDNIDVRGQVTTAGTSFLGDNVADFDAYVVVRLRAAGALISGKTNLHEFAYGATGLNPHHGTPPNPFDPQRVPGGSSSGSAVAVASKIVPLALGTDAAGSIRMPASLCGIVGLKPTHGRVSARGLVASHNATVDHIGPLARTVADAARCLQAIAGYDPADPMSLDEPVPDYVAALDQRQSLRGVRVGIPSTYFFDCVDPEVEDGVRRAIDSLGHLGATLVSVDIPDVMAMMAARLALFADGLAWHVPHLRSQLHAYSPEIRQRLLTDLFVQGHEYARASRVRRLLQERFARAFRDTGVDVLASPTTPMPAPLIDQDYIVLPSADGHCQAEPVGLAMLRLTAPANLTGLPALSVPAGLTQPAGLPFGLQLMARPFDESVLLSVAHVYEQSAPAPRMRSVALSR